MHFQKIDPLANGLDEDIAAEYVEADSSDPLADPTPDELQSSWTKIIEEAKQDSDWIDFQTE